MVFRQGFDPATYLITKQQLITVGNYDVDAKTRISTEIALEVITSINAFQQEPKEMTESLPGRMTISRLMPA